MSRNLRRAHRPPPQPRRRWSGYLTAPATDAQGQAAIGPVLTNVLLWRTRAALPADWPAADDSEIQGPPAGVTPIWGEGTSVSTASVIGDPQTPWRLLVGSGQLVIENVWLLDTTADPWQPTCAAPPPCPPCASGETVVPPTAPCHPIQAGLIGALIGGVITVGALIVTGRRV